MTASPDESTASHLSRRERAHKTVCRACTGALVGAGIALAGWIAAQLLAFTVLLAAGGLTALALVVAVARHGLPAKVWGALIILWTAILCQRWLVHGNGGLLIAGGAWLGMFYALRKAGTSKWLLPLLAYPLVMAIVLVVSGHGLFRPFGTSWLWPVAVVGPALGIRTLLAARKVEKTEVEPASA